MLGSEFGVGIGIRIGIVKSEEKKSIPIAIAIPDAERGARKSDFGHYEKFTT